MPHQCTGCGHAFEDGSKEMLSGCPECGGNKFQFRPEGEPLPDDPDAPDGPPGPDAPDAAGADERTSAGEAGSVAETVGRATTRVRDFVSTNPDPAGTDAASPPDPQRSWPSETEATTDEAGAATGETDDRPQDRDTDVPAEADDEASGGEIIDADARRDERDGSADDEDVAQASARSDVVTNDELDDAQRRDDAGTPTARSSADDRQVRDESDTGDGSEVAGGTGGDDPDLSELREQLHDQFESIKILEPGQYELNLMELYDREEYIIALQENGRYVIQVPDQWIGDDLDDR